MQRLGHRQRPVAIMDLAGILFATILVGGFIAIATGMAAILGMLQMASGGGIRHVPPVSSTSIIARQRAVDARLRARYLQRQPVAALPALDIDTPAEETARSQPPEAVTPWIAAEEGGLIGSLADPLAG